MCSRLPNETFHRNRPIVQETTPTIPSYCSAHASYIFSPFISTLSYDCSASTDVCLRIRINVR